MKKEFSWYFPTPDAEIESIWKRGLLTVDANVLLDLYRYHESTRNALINSLKEFRGRLWLSNQAAEEFIRNRTSVIVSSDKTFKQAKNEVEELKRNLDSTIERLKGNRIIPVEVADDLIERIDPVINDALKKITNFKSSHPDYLKTDPILGQLTHMFKDSVGEGFPDDELMELTRVAEERTKNKIPPGYLDEEKDEGRQYGDFFLWRQILSKARNDKTPIIFVTSERKEDWWERISGKTIGPRPELLRESSEFSQQRILIYQTDRFLEFASKHSGSELDSNAVDEIRAIDSLRSDTEQAVEVLEQRSIQNGGDVQEGMLVLKLRRPVKNLTGTGYLDPYMESTPVISVKLISAPEALGRYKLRGGAGTNYDFNVHVISGEYGQPLPVGTYTLKYHASCREPAHRTTTIKELAEVLGVTPTRLLEQFRDAGVSATDEGHEISSTEKRALLESLRNKFGSTSGERK